MAEFAKEQLDFVAFLYGLAYMVLASTTFSLWKTDSRRLPWGWMVLFSLALGLYGWKGMLDSIVPKDVAGVISNGLLVCGYACRLEFGRRGLTQNGWRRPHRWLLPVALLLAMPGLLYSDKSLEIWIRLPMSLISGFLATWAMFATSRKLEPSLRRPLVLAGCMVLVLIIWAQTVVLILPGRTGGTPSDAASIWIAMVELVKVIIVLVMAAALRKYCHGVIREELGESKLSFRMGRFSWTAAALVGVLVMGWLLTQNLGDGARKLLQKDGMNKVEAMGHRLEDQIAEVEHATASMAKSPLIREFFSGNAPARKAAEELLDRYNESWGFAACYIIGEEGRCLASTNRNTPQTFVGVDYTFRPYFQEAIKGRPGRYFALGTKSGERGFFASWPILDSAGKIIGVAVIKKILDRLESDLSAYPYAFFIDPHGVIFLSSRPERVLGSLWPISEEAKKRLIEARQFGKGPFRPLLSERFTHNKSVVLAGRPQTALFHEIGNQGWSMVILCDATPLKEARLIGIMIALFLSLLTLGFSTALQQSHCAQTRLTASETSLRATKLEAEAASRAKSAFLANMSHELRTPMTAILGFLELLNDENLPGPQRVSYLQTIHRHGQHLLSLINDILDISKIEAGKMTMERVTCPLRELVADVALIMKPRALEKGIRFEVQYGTPVPAAIQSDPTRLRQILMNLLGNAIKFTDIGLVKLEVLLTPPADAGRKLQFCVSDTGCGITPAQKVKLFQHFEQADASTTRRFGGTGLGLAISQKLAQMLNGSINVTSAVGQGSRFTLTIDPGPSVCDNLVEMTGEIKIQPASIPTPPATAAALRNIYILLTEDGEDNQVLIGTILRKAGAQVESAFNGQQALEAIEAARQAGSSHDLILMDMQMPVMDGYQATAAIRRMGIQTPILALTANAMAEDRRKCLDAGCTEYLSKPINRQALLGMIAKLTAASKVLPAEPVATPVADKGRPAEPIVSAFCQDGDLAELIAQFVGQLPMRVEEMRQALAHGDWETLRRNAHQLKGAGGGYGYDSITETARALEIHAKTNDSEAALLVLNKLAEICRCVETGLAASKPQS